MIRCAESEIGHLPSWSSLRKKEKREREVGGIEIRRIEETREAEVRIGVMYMTHMQTGLKGVGLNCRNANILSSEENIYAAVILLASLNQHFTLPAFTLLRTYQI